MNAYTRQDLSVMQAWPLERKIRVTQAKIIEWYHHYDGKVAVSFSGGKDSTVLLDLARRAFPDIPAVFVDTAGIPGDTGVCQNRSQCNVAAPGDALFQGHIGIRLSRHIQGCGAAHPLRPKGRHMGALPPERPEPGRYALKIQ